MTEKKGESLFVLGCALAALLVALWAPSAGAVSCKVFAIESPKEDNYFNQNTRDVVTQAGYTPVSFTNLSDLSTAINNHLTSQGCDCISELVLGGHGQAHRFSVGCGAFKTCTANEYIGTDNIATWAPVMNAIGQKMCEGLASEGVWFYGCSMGVCDDAAQLLHDLAQVMGTYTHGATQSVFGGMLFDEMNQTSKWQIGIPSAPARQPCKIGDTLYAEGMKRGADTYWQCPCNGSLYQDGAQCNASCPSGLLCFNHTCSQVYINTYLDRADGNPVVKKSAAAPRQAEAPSAAAWDDGGVSAPSVVHDSTGYKMWYTGYDATDTYWTIGLATSYYGDTWTMHGGNPVLSQGSAAAWDSTGVYNPTVIKDGAVYKMWFHGHDGTNSRIGYATSGDGIVWTKSVSNPVVNLGSQSSDPDYNGVGEPTVLKDGSTYHMWYGCYDGYVWRICYATSPDGVVWTKHPSNPVLSEDPGWEWDNGGVGGPAVVKLGGRYVMYYSGMDWNDTTIAAIGRAHSSDGVNWTKDLANPILTSTGGKAWESVNVFHPCLLVDENLALMRVWYRATDGADYAIGASSTPLYAAASGGGLLRLLLD